VASFLHTNHLPSVGCSFVASFGMDGYGTLVWNRIIRQRFSDWLKSPRFTIAELVYKKPIPAKPLSTEFADDESFVEVCLLT
jgi:hypothetical protein